MFIYSNLSNTALDFSFNILVRIVLIERRALMIGFNFDFSYIGITVSIKEQKN